MASGEIRIMPYKEENEKEILSQMEKQARNAKPKKSPKKDLLLGLSQPLIVLVLPIAIMTITNNIHLYWAALTLGLIEYISYYTASIIRDEKERRDIRKLKYFLEHKEELEKIKGKKKVKSRRINKIKKDESKIQETTEPININNIDNYSLKELKELKEALISPAKEERDEPKKEKEKQLVRKY